MVAVWWLYGGYYLLFPKISTDLQQNIETRKSAVIP